MNEERNKKLVDVKANGTSQTNIDALILAFNKRKWVLITAFILIIVCGSIFYLTKSPIYESTILLKKQDQPKDQNAQDQYLKLVANQSLDDIETEIQLINTRSVLSRIEYSFSTIEKGGAVCLPKSSSFTLLGPRIPI